MIRRYLYDGTSESFLTALSRALTIGEEATVEPKDSFAAGLFDVPELAPPDAAAAMRLLQRAKRQISPSEARRLYYLSLARDPAAGRVGLFFLRLAFGMGTAVSDYEADERVRRFHGLAGRVAAEIHRLKGLARFRQVSDGLWYAPLTPDHRVLFPLAFHFRRRMPAERWILHDIPRGEAVAWDGHAFRLRQLPLPASFPGGDANGLFPERSSAEAEVQALWRTFFEHIALSKREHKALQARNMPRRYWPYLVELCE
jgi:probable DNA metabolism protein